MEGGRVLHCQGIGRSFITMATTGMHSMNIQRMKPYTLGKLLGPISDSSALKSTSENFDPAKLF